MQTITASKARPGQRTANVLLAASLLIGMATMLWMLDYWRTHPNTEQKDRAMNKARLISVALMMYSQDYDGRLPPQAAMGDPQRSEQIRTLLGSYVKTGPSFFEDSPLIHREGSFKYLADGESIGNDASVDAEHILGYVCAPEGNYAYLFADGHVEWLEGEGYALPAPPQPQLQRKNSAGR